MRTLPGFVGFAAALLAAVLAVACATNETIDFVPVVPGDAGGTASGDDAGPGPGKVGVGDPEPDAGHPVVGGDAGGATADAGAKAADAGSSAPDAGAAVDASSPIHDAGSQPDAAEEVDAAPSSCGANPNYQPSPFCQIVPMATDSVGDPISLCQSCAPIVWQCMQTSTGDPGGTPQLDTGSSTKGLVVSTVPWVATTYPTVVTLCTTDKTCAPVSIRGSQGNVWCPPSWIDQSAGTWDPNPASYPLAPLHTQCATVSDAGVNAGLFHCAN